jgi:hypothetical protein
MRRVCHGYGISHRRSEITIVIPRNAGTVVTVPAWCVPCRLPEDGGMPMSGALFFTEHVGNAISTCA